MRSTSRGLQRIERLLWVTAVLALSLVGGVKVVSALDQSYLNWSFARTLGGEPVSATLFAHYLVGEPADSSPTARITRTAQPQPKPDTPWMARLEIPRLNYSVMVREGTDRSTLALGVGHIEGTALPGQVGNVGLAGHRDTFFRRLGELKIGDSLRLQTLGGDYTYKVTRVKIVKPYENEVLSSTQRPTLTLVTCYPFWGIGAAPKRYIVQANRIGPGYSPEGR